MATQKQKDAAWAAYGKAMDQADRLAMNAHRQAQRERATARAQLDAVLDEDAA